MADDYEGTQDSSIPVSSTPTDSNGTPPTTTSTSSSNEAANPAQNDSSTEEGSSCTVKRLWEGRNSSDRLIWLTAPPKVEYEEPSELEDPQYTITLQHRIIRDTNRQSLDTIVMRGAALRNFLETTIPNASSLYSEDEHGIAMRQPFRLLFWHLDQIEAATRSSDRKLSEATTLLYDVLMDEFREVLVKRTELLKGQEMNFDTLWTIFKPGMTCLTYYVATEVVAVKVNSIELSRNSLGMKYYRVKYSYLSWDGEYLGWEDEYEDILEFNGRRKIIDLDIFPIEFYGESNVSQKLVARGRKFVELAVKEPHMMSFGGEVLDKETSPMWWQGEQKKKVSFPYCLVQSVMPYEEFGGLPHSLPARQNSGLSC